MVKSKEMIMYEKLINQEARLAVIGLGYVGLPIALEFAKKSLFYVLISKKIVEMIMMLLVP